MKCIGEMLDSKLKLLGEILSEYTWNPIQSFCKNEIRGLFFLLFLLLFPVQQNLFIFLLNFVSFKNFTAMIVKE